MQNDLLTHHIAQDVAQFLNAEFGWTEPADGYIDPLTQMFGKRIDHSEFLKFYRSPTKIKKLAKALQAWCESSDITVDLVTAMLKQSIMNNFGRSALNE